MAVLKEMLLLKRDFGGLIILFVMPLVLIITITLIQDSAFKAVGKNKIPILLVDNDHGAISETVLNNLHSNNSFEIITELDGQPVDDATAQEAVFRGDYQLAISIPENLSKDLEYKVNQNVSKITERLGLSEEESTPQQERVLTQKEIRLYFDPATQLTFKNAVKNAIDKMISQIETKSIYSSFQDQFDMGEEPLFDQNNFIVFKEVVPSVNDKEVLPNSVQHNVPAWSLFAIFFIIVPLSINIVKEKSQGTMTRLIINPTPYYLLVLGKTATYLVICLIQFLLMVLIGVYVFSYIGLPQLDVSNTLLVLCLVAGFAGLAAIGLGILLGTIAKTQEQAAPFGATLVVILAAIGGVWVPVFAMPKVMQVVSTISPMNWGLSAFYDILLRNGGITAVFPELIFLFLFFLITILIAVAYEKKERAV